MEKTLQKDMYDWLAGSKVNVDVVFAGDDRAGSIVNVRLRPWKNGQRQGVMVLCASYSVDDALLLAVRAVNANRWIPLDWAARCERFGLYAPETVGVPAQAGTQRAMLDPALFSSPDQGNDQDPYANGAQEGVQERTGENTAKNAIHRVK